MSYSSLKELLLKVEDDLKEADRAQAALDKAYAEEDEYEYEEYEYEYEEYEPYEED